MLKVAICSFSGMLMFYIRALNENAWSLSPLTILLTNPPFLHNAVHPTIHTVPDSVKRSRRFDASRSILGLEIVPLPLETWCQQAGSLPKHDCWL